MSLENARKAVSTVIDKVTSSRAPTIKLREFSIDENGLARIVAAVTHTSTSRSDDSEVFTALNGLFGNKIHAVENTFSVLASNKFTDMVTGVVAPVQESMPFDVENGAAGFKCLAGNMYMDSDECLWNLKQTECGNLLIKTDSLDDINAISELMNSVSSSVTEPLRFEDQVNVMLNYASMAGSIEGGDYIDFVDPNSRTAEFGIVVASVVNEDENGVETDTGNLIVLSSTGEKEVTISRELVIAKHADVETPVSDESAYDSMSGGVDLETMVAYYRSMFRRSPEYFAMFEQRLRNHKFQ